LNKRVAVFPLRCAKQVRQLSDASCDAPDFVARQQRRSGAPSGLALEIHVRQCLPVVIPDDEAASVVLFDVPRGREAAAGHINAGIYIELQGSRKSSACFMHWQFE
jgi:hypothetical protein